MKTKWTEDDFRSAVRNSETIADTARRLNLPPLGGSYDTIKRYVRIFDIDTSHWLGLKYHRPKGKNCPKIPLDLLLVQNCGSCRSTLKKRLVKENILKNICVICGQLGTWNGKKLTMVLDHINGVNNDNRIENLRMVCPNCNTQLPTFCGRKNKIYRKCVNCGESISRDAKRCPSCAKENFRKVQRPSYEQLKSDISNMSMVKIGKKYGVSDNAIRKWLRYYEKNSLTELATS